MSTTTLFRARVSTQRLRRAEKVFARLGMKLEEALSLFLAAVALRGDLPFAVAADAGCVLSAAEQGKNWEEAFGEY